MHFYVVSLLSFSFRLKNKHYLVWFLSWVKNQAVPLRAPLEASRTSLVLTGYATYFCCICLCVFDFAVFCISRILPVNVFVLAFCSMFPLSYLFWDFNTFFKWHLFSGCSVFLLKEIFWVVAARDVGNDS